MTPEIGIVPVMKTEIPSMPAEEWFGRCKAAAILAMKESGEVPGPIVSLLVEEDGSTFDVTIYLGVYPAELRADIARSIASQAGAKAVLVTMDAWIKLAKPGESIPTGGLEGLPGTEERLVFLTETMGESEIQAYQIKRDPIELEVDESFSEMGFISNFANLLVPYAPPASA